MLLSPVIAAYNFTLNPLIAGISILDIVAAFRLCLVIRQMKTIARARHTAPAEHKPFLHSLSITLMVVYGGEAMTAPLLGIPPSFILSGVYPCLYAFAQATIDALPAVPMPSIYTELPLAIIDGFTRSFLLCSLIPPPVTANVSPVLSASPWALLVSSFVTANGGFFLVALFSMIEPTPLAIATPTELLPYGWTNVDFWCPPLITGTYALFTHAQPFWADAHVALVEFFGLQAKGTVEPVDPDVIRAACAVVLAGLFVDRAFKMTAQIPKIKTQ